MKHLGTQMLESRRLVLRPFRPSDAQAMYDNWASDPEVTKFLSWPTYKSVDTAHTILALTAVMTFLFEEVGVQRIEAGQDSNNLASGAVMRECGMRQEAILRRRIRSNQGITDVALYAALKEDR